MCCWMRRDGGVWRDGGGGGLEAGAGGGGGVSAVADPFGGRADAGKCGGGGGGGAPSWVDVAGGVESAPGVKDADLVREFVARARGAL